MASKDTGFHRSDPDWTRGRAQAVAQADAIARQQINMARTVKLAATVTPPAIEPDCPDCGLPHPSRNPYCFCSRPPADTTEDRT